MDPSPTAEATRFDLTAEVANREDAEKASRHDKSVLEIALTCEFKVHPILRLHFGAISHRVSANTEAG